MSEYATPKVVVSQCLEFDACRYNGDQIADETVRSLMPFVHFIPVCPEVEIGLGTPRETIRIVDDDGTTKLIQPSTSKNLSAEMSTFTKEFLQRVGKVDGFILKSRSPSCGPRDVPIYVHADKGAAKNGKTSGYFAEQVLEAFSNKAIEEEGRLRNFTIREHFLTKLFTLAEYRELKEEPSMSRLVAFHSKHKYLFMAYNQHRLKALGRIVANHDNKKLSDVLDEYEQMLELLFARAARYTSNMNVCEHIFGYFSKQLKQTEKQYFQAMLEQYRLKKLPLSSLTGVLKSWIIRFENDYLQQQSFFQPYPSELVSISDSGKGRDYA